MLTAAPRTVWPAADLPRPRPHTTSESARATWKQEPACRPVTAAQRPTMKFVATKTADQLDLQALHRVRERLVSQRTGVINQIRAFLLERGVAVRPGRHFLRARLPGILATGCEVLSERMVHLIEDLAGD
jgi:transposase